MVDVSASSEALTTMLTTFRKVTASYWPGLFHFIAADDGYLFPMVFANAGEESCPRGDD
jgi:hypothetical protein